MNTTSFRAEPTRAVLRTEARLFAREPAAMFWIVVFPTALLCILGAIPSFRVDRPGLGGFSTIDLFVPVSVLVSMALAAVQSMPQSLLGYREAGVLRRLRTTPVGPTTLIGAQVLIHVGAVVVSTALVLLVSRVAFDTALPASWIGYLVAYVLALIATFSVGSLVTAVAPNPRVGAAISTVVVFPLLFTAGVWIPVQAMPDLLRRMVDFTPLGAASEAMTETMGGHVPALGHLLVVAVWACGLALISVRSFRWE